MSSTSLYPNRQVVQIKKAKDFLLTLLLLGVAFFVLSYFFHIGAEYAAEIVVSVEPPEPPQPGS